MQQSDIIFVIIVSTLALLGLLLNILLLFLIFFKSPNSLTPYRVFLADTTITQCIFAIFTLFSQPRVLSVGSYTICIYMGLVQFSGPWLSAMSYMGMVHLAVNSFISIMLSMVFRYLSINDHKLSVRTCVIMCVLGYMVPLVSYLSCSSAKVSQDPILNDELIGSIVDNFTQYNMVVATDVQNQPAILIFILLISIGYVPIYAVMYWCRYKIYKQLKETSESQSNTTRENVKRFVRALTIQSLVPVFSIFPASVFYCLAQAGIVGSAFNSYVIVPCIALSCLCDPIITIRCVIPYRKYICRILPIQSNECSTTNDRTITVLQKYPCTLI